ncbi:hypothetical protein HN018_21555 [Lichenicola cladoniae]|uniref:Uncharacterized protein n=1 Tax=Lichenicola cladoniae TaxID=1484109 RepID=A0A6M8HVL7_9PROT|nr:hypothetical protein [Lichenicola cladoniae]NPD66647.1 hypothetical protein [Acetobacteraceae bacterium]QKE92276.1 hypothetical protein HN018_21555 [Lichenicola cladoniae]
MSNLSAASIRLDAQPARLPLRSAQGVLAALAFANLLVSSNAMHPLLPIFRQTLRLDPLEISMTMVCYVGVLCIVLLVLSQPRLVRWSPLFLCVALAVVMLGDAVLATASTPRPDDWPRPDGPCRRVRDGIGLGSGCHGLRRSRACDLGDR